MFKQILPFLWMFMCAMLQSLTKITEWKNIRVFIKVHNELTKQSWFYIHNSNFLSCVFISRECTCMIDEDPRFNTIMHSSFSKYPVCCILSKNIAYACFIYFVYYTCIFLFQTNYSILPCIYMQHKCEKFTYCKSIYRNFPKFSDRQVWAYSADPD